MQKITLYKYARDNGGVTVSPIMPDSEYVVLYRLVADEGYALTDGATTCECVDTDSPDNWTEIPGSNENTDADYAEAGKILMGVSE